MKNRISSSSPTLRVSSVLAHVFSTFACLNLSWFFVIIDIKNRKWRTRYFKFINLLYFTVKETFTSALDFSVVVVVVAFDGVLSNHEPQLIMIWWCLNLILLPSPLSLSLIYSEFKFSTLPSSISILSSKLCLVSKLEGMNNNNKNVQELLLEWESNTEAPPIQVWVMTRIEYSNIPSLRFSACLISRSIIFQKASTCFVYSRDGVKRSFNPIFVSYNSSHSPRCVFFLIQRFAVEYSLLDPWRRRIEKESNSISISKLIS